MERVQRCALYIILGEDYTSYDDALDTLECDNLDVRRDKLCKNFAKRAFKNPKYTNLFCIDDSVPQNLILDNLKILGPWSTLWPR